MSIVEYAEKVLEQNLTCYQKELLVLLSNNPRGYLHDVLVKKPSDEIKRVAAIYNRFIEDMLVGA